MPNDGANHRHNRGCASVSARAAGLFSESWFYRDPFAPLSAPAGNYLLAALGLHALAKSVNFRSLAPVGLECTLGHEKYVLLIRSTVLGQTVSINHKGAQRQTSSSTFPRTFHTFRTRKFYLFALCSLELQVRIVSDEKNQGRRYMRTSAGGQERDGRGRLYTDYALCDWCGATLEGEAFECSACQSLICTLCICVDERCPECTRSGGEDLS